MYTTYSSTLQVRTESGFYGNPDISDDTIDAIRNQAYNIVRGIVAGKYNITHLVPGDTLFDSSQAAGLLERAEILIAAGNLLNQEYGPEQMWQDYDGDRKIKEGKSLLFQLFDNKAPTRLIDSTGFEFTGTSPTDNGDDGIVMTISDAPRAFTVDQQF